MGKPGFAGWMDKVLTETKLKHAEPKFLKEADWKNEFFNWDAINDKNKNLIAIAKLATPIKKTEERALTFKLKIDM